MTNGGFQEVNAMSHTEGLFIQWFQGLPGGEKVMRGGQDDGRGDGWMAHQLAGHESEQAWGAGEGRRGLASCSPWGRKELYTTERLN